MDDLTELEKAVLYGTAEKVSELCGQSEFTARALGFACLYRGLDMVRLLVEYGAVFRYPWETDVPDDMKWSRYTYRDKKSVLDYSVLIIGSSKTLEYFKFIDGFKLIGDLEISPVSERSRVLDYLCDNAEKTGFDPQKLLFFSILDGCEEFYSVLKRHGAEIPQESRWLFKNACNFSYDMDKQMFLKVYGMIVRELGDEKIRGNMTFYGTYIKDVLSPETFEFILENFDKKGMNQTKLLKTLVDKEAVSCLAIAEREGWLKMPRRRDELLQYAADNGKTECTAWLLEFKNRTADLAAERAKAEKKAERELNADPNSVTELKKIWKYEKRDDGTVIITGYKGNRTEIIVPEKIGKLPVTAIGKHAFSPLAPRLTEERALNRCRITKITVPSSVRAIGESAFGGAFCTSQNTNAISLLKEVILPSSLEVFAEKESAENSPKIFAFCPKLTVKVPHSPYAEIFCRRNRVNFEFYGG
ncbi:MAG: leucine-rich repeat domain-containing protein [Oscillospiraceae bacterium]|nr:leucine-rich repeat domain-containing protein [Oscillospiraceae bacterium]